MQLNITSLLHRRVIWDVIPHDYVSSLFPKLNLSPGSQEGFDKEHQESHRRLAETYALDDLVTVLSGFAGGAVATLMLENQESLPYIDDDDKETFIEAFRQMAIVVVNGVLANLIELDRVHVHEEGGIKL